MQQLPLAFNGQSHLMMVLVLVFVTLSLLQLEGLGQWTLLSLTYFERPHFQGE